MSRQNSEKKCNLFIPLIILFIRFVHLSVYLPKPKMAQF